MRATATILVAVATLAAGCASAPTGADTAPEPTAVVQIVIGDVGEDGGLGLGPTCGSILGQQPDDVTVDGCITGESPNITLNGIGSAVCPTGARYLWFDGPDGVTWFGLGDGWVEIPAGEWSFGRVDEACA